MFSSEASWFAFLEAFSVSTLSIPFFFPLLSDLADAILAGRDLAADPVLGKHAQWVAEIQKQTIFTPENALDVLLQQTGKVFSAVLEDAGVYKCTPEGREAFLRFIQSV